MKLHVCTKAKQRAFCLLITDLSNASFLEVHYHFSLSGNFFFQFQTKSISRDGQPPIIEITKAVPSTPSDKHTPDLLSPTSKVSTLLLYMPLEHENHARFF